MGGWTEVAVVVIGGHGGCSGGVCWFEQRRHKGGRILSLIDLFWLGNKIQFVSDYKTQKE